MAYIEDEGVVRSYLVSTEAQTVSTGKNVDVFRFREGKGIPTEET